MDSGEIVYATVEEVIGKTGKSLTLAGPAGERWLERLASPPFWQLARVVGHTKARQPLSEHLSDKGVFDWCV